MTQVTEHLETHGVPFVPITHQQTYTSIAEATTLPLVKHADENDKDWLR